VGDGGEGCLRLGYLPCLGLVFRFLSCLGIVFRYRISV